MRKICALSLCAFTVQPYCSARSDMYTASVVILQGRRELSVAICSKCIVDNVMVNRMIRMTEEHKYKYLVLGTLVQFSNMRNLCESRTCELEISHLQHYNLGTAVELSPVQMKQTIPQQSNEIEVSPVQMKQTVPQQSNDETSLTPLCIVHSVSGPCVQCLARAVPEWEKMYSNVLLDPVYSHKLVMTVIYSKKANLKEMQACYHTNCLESFGALDPPVCNLVVKDRIDENSGMRLMIAARNQSQKKRGVLDLNTGVQKKRKKVHLEVAHDENNHGTTLSLNDQNDFAKKKKKKDLNAKKLADKINAAGNIVSTKCVRVICSRYHISTCIKRVLKMTSSSFGIMFSDQVDTSKLVLLYAEPEKISLTNIKNEKRSNDACKVEVIDSKSCFSASTKLLEYPNHEQNKVQHHSICVAANHHTNGQKTATCLNGIQNAVGINITQVATTSDISSLITISHSDLRSKDYNNLLALIMKRSVLHHKCAITVYSPEVCTWHAEMQFGKIYNLNYQPTTDFKGDADISTVESALWPPCQSTPEEAKKDPLQRYFAAVKLSIQNKKTEDLRKDKCFKCVTELLEVFFINIVGNSYMWMTQIPVADVKECVKQGCAIFGICHGCTKDPPSANPLSIYAEDVQSMLEKHMFHDSSNV